MRAGGLGYGLRVFLKGKFESGFDLFARLSDLEKLVRTSDLIITAEGAIDRSTAMGKGAGAVGELAKSLGKRCIALAGTVKERPAGLFDFIYSIHPEIAALGEAQRNAKAHLKAIAGVAAKSLS